MPSYYVVTVSYRGNLLFIILTESYSVVVPQYPPPSPYHHGVATHLTTLKAECLRDPIPANLSNRNGDVKVMRFLRKHPKIADLKISGLSNCRKVLHFY